MRPFSLLATLLTVAALAFYIVAASSSHWVNYYDANVQAFDGPYQSCWRQHDVGIDECRHVDNDCTADFSEPVGSHTVYSGCNTLRTVRAFLILAIFFTACALICKYLSSFPQVPLEPYRTPGILFSFLAGLMGLITWAVFLAVATDKGDGWTYGYAFALLTAAWALNWLSALITCLPYPYAAYEERRPGELESVAVKREPEERVGISPEAAARTGARSGVTGSLLASMQRALPGARSILGEKEARAQDIERGRASKYGAPAGYGERVEEERLGGYEPERKTSVSAPPPAISAAALGSERQAGIGPSGASSERETARRVEFDPSSREKI